MGQRVWANIHSLNHPTQIQKGIVMKSYKYKLKPSARTIAIFEAWLAIC
jgi:hypothetical protein